MVAAGALVVGVAVSLWPLTGWVIEFLKQDTDTCVGPGPGNHTWDVGFCGSRRSHDS